MHHPAAGWEDVSLEEVSFCHPKPTLFSFIPNISCLLEFYRPRKCLFSLFCFFFIASEAVKTAPASSGRKQGELV